MGLISISDHQRGCSSGLCHSDIHTLGFMTASSHAQEYNHSRSKYYRQTTCGERSGCGGLTCAKELGETAAARLSQPEGSSRNTAADGLNAEGWGGEGRLGRLASSTASLLFALGQATGLLREAGWASEASTAFITWRGLIAWLCTQVLQAISPCRHSSSCTNLLLSYKYATHAPA